MSRMRNVEGGKRRRKKKTWRDIKEGEEKEKEEKREHEKKEW